MRAKLATIYCLFMAACGSDPVTEPTDELARLFFVNGFGANVDVLVDGAIRASNVASGEITPLDLAVGLRNVGVRPTGASATSSLGVHLAVGASVAVAALRGGGGALMVQALEDSNAVVPAGATKLRVLHLAARVGEVQVWRTQPDYGTPIRWAFPFMYNTVNTYYQSTPGTWDVRVWTDGSSSWTTAVNTARVTLASGAKKTVAILDRAGGGIRLEVID